MPAFVVLASMMPACMHVLIFCFSFSSPPKVRIVYFPAANTHENLEFQAKLGIQTYYAEPLQFPAFVQLNGGLHSHSSSSFCRL